jgi:hypothetical protein
MSRRHGLILGANQFAWYSRYSCDHVETKETSEYQLWTFHAVVTCPHCFRGLTADGDSATSSSEESTASDSESESSLDDAIPSFGAPTDDLQLDVEKWGVGAAAGRPDIDTSLQHVEEATARLAVVDLLWSRMRAVDIFAVLQSFVGGGGGALQQVTVYVSNYGEKEMALEKVHGPKCVPEDTVRTFLPSVGGVCLQCWELL